LKASFFTIGRKAASIVTALVGIGLVFIIVLQSHQQKTLLKDSVSKSYQIVVELLAGQVSGQFRWSKPEAIEKAFENLQAVDSNALVAIYARDVDGKELLSLTEDAA
jgi:hypothetical protein